MYFNDLHLLYKFTGVPVSQSYTDTHIHMSKWMEYYGMLNFLGSNISKTIHLIVMKFTKVT